MSEKSKNTAVALPSQFTLDKIPGLLTQINEKIKSLEGDSEETSVMSGPIDMFGELKNINEPIKLMEVYNYVTKKMEGVEAVSPIFKEAAPTVKVPTMKIAGTTLPILQKAILSRYKAVTLAEVLTSLKKTKTVLEECLSEEDKKVAKLQNAGEALASLLGA